VDQALASDVKHRAFRNSAGTGLTILPRCLRILALALPLFACATDPKESAGSVTTPSVARFASSSDEEAAYRALFPYYAEICAVSQLEKKPGFGAKISSGIGGHAVLYLNGLCRVPDSAYPVLALCDEIPGKSTADGVGLSVNAHYANANWVAVDGRDFFFEGGLPPGQELTRAAYQTTMAVAKAKRIYDAIDFHDETYEDMPAGFTRADFKYEISASTDFAIAFGRNRYCGRVPLDRSQMTRIVTFLNGLNEPYRTGAAIFDWNLFTHNCAHMNHNALAAAGLWEPWEIDRFFLIALFDFPVPKNEFVNLMRRTNDFPIDDLEAVYDDAAAKQLLLHEDRLPTQPGAIADIGSIIPQNDLYDTESNIIFYDDPIVGRYQDRFDNILSEKRYTELQANFRYFSALYERIQRARKPLEWYIGKRDMPAAEQRDFAIFYRKYYDYIDKEAGETARQIAFLSASPQGGVRP
jgi:hypothetical protein